ncbi:MAG: hypothetical protein NWF05_05430 [Candidatus Bathyarchaeota archaeon]|nr:hypothetical protein [Candidatus Bathyarchaeota archaeon]
MVDKFEKTLRRLFSPVVAYRGWEDAVTDEMKNNILTERLANFSSKTATDMEAMVYLHTASLATPLGVELTNVYSYLFSKYYPKQAKEIGNYTERMDETEQRELAKLKDWIYKKTDEII